MDELVTWLRAVLDEIGDTARAQGGERETWQSYDVPELPMSWDGVNEHIALHDPRAVLARVAAERAIVDDAVLMAQPVLAADSSDSSLVDAIADRQQTGHELLRSLAYGHRYDAAGYRDEWKPEWAVLEEADATQQRWHDQLSGNT